MWMDEDVTLYNLCSSGSMLNEESSCRACLELGANIAQINVNDLYDAEAERSNRQSYCLINCHCEERSLRRSNLILFLNIILDGASQDYPTGNKMGEKQYFIYIMTTMTNTAQYTGVTNNLQRRVLEHRLDKGSVFTKKNKLYKLVYYETGDNIHSALAREKQIKGGSRHKKVEMINSINPHWDDLFEKFFG
jgi:putative endonuclease